MILADDLVTLHAAHAERETAMKADVSGGRQRAVGQPKDRDPFVEQPGCVGLVGDRLGEGDRKPERGQRASPSR